MTTRQIKDPFAKLRPKSIIDAMERHMANGGIYTRSAVQIEKDTPNSVWVIDADSGLSIKLFTSETRARDAIERASELWYKRHEQD